MTTDPSHPTEALQTLLREKTLTLLAREREFHSLRQRHVRAMGWLDAVDGLSKMGGAGEADAIIHALPTIAARATGVQYGAICTVLGIELSCVSWFGAHQLDLNGELLLRPLRLGEVGAAGPNSSMSPFHEHMALRRFLWGAIGGGQQKYLLMLGFDHNSARFYPGFDPDDTRYMRMLCQHVATMLSLAASLEALREEHRQLWNANQSLLRHDHELSAANQRLEQQSQQLKGAFRKLEEAHDQLLHSERLAAIGSLAAAVAHEVNNPATYVLANLEELQSDGVTDETRARLLKETSDGVYQISRIVRELRMFSRSEREPFQDISPQELAATALRIAAGRVRHIAQVKTNIATHERLWGDAGQLTQVLLNLILNAAQAMDPSQVERNLISVHAHDGGHGSHIIFRIRDNGSGIAPDTIKKIFDPFFTTKPKESGTGLGLSIVRQIIAGHNGSIDVTSTLGEGTEFVVTLPSTRRPSLPPAPSNEPVVPTSLRNRRVLVVDDDPRVLRVHARMLQRDFVVQTAESGEQALRLIQQEDGWDAVVCDLMMPGIDGMRLRDAAAATHRQLAGRFIFVSGGVADETMRERLVREGVRYLYKPFRRNDLIMAICDALATDHEQEC